MVTYTTSQMAGYVSDNATDFGTGKELVKLLKNHLPVGGLACHSLGGQVSIST